ncbi:FGGY-family carbohydrate kinase [Shinella zoogloeoides]|uniref:Carbohydrate kinase n=1 Tax=Shinella zoogloeoides TaxID=352475 RepID=A0A6N8TDW1_SHIZO|nr:FGGY-family carbohydrate kinase [Shinella zoogloeoides]MXO01139.1 carbohydrate kinase [Shinella zoogloeoides]UEX84326.1 carbohydrate kinase [Shinella zoogloeoides]
MPCIMGIDSGLTVTKAVIFDADGTVLSVARRRVAQSIPAPRHVERDMDGLWAATADAIREAVAACGLPAGDIVAIAATAHGDGIYLLDADRRPLGNAILSLDTRAGTIADAWNEGDVGARSLALTGQKPHASAPSAILRWIRDNDPARYARIAHFIAAKDWLRFCLCGTIGTDRTEASTSFTDVRTQDYAKEAFGLFGLDRLAGRQPPMAGSTEIVGGVTAETARLTGLVAGTPVMAGLHDVTASALGMGGYGAGTVAVIAGTYSINETVSFAPQVDGRWFCRNGILPGEWNNMSISPASTANYDWFIEQFCGGEARQAEAAGDSIHALLGREFEAARERPSGVFFHPYLFGSPFGGASSAGFYGLNAWHDRGDLLRGVLEGIAFNHRVHVDALRDGFAPTAARLTGGISRNPAMASLFADILGLPVTATRTDEAAAWGAALCAGAGAGLFASPTDDPRNLAAIETTYRPDSGRQRAYDEKYRVFLDLAEAMKPLWPVLGRLGGAKT